MLEVDRGALLPTTRDEMSARGWREIDVLLVTGDAYFDHASHGAAVIGRVLEAAGYRVGLAARPDWRSTDDFCALGRPALFAGVTAGAVDSQLNNFTADRARRRDDAYAPGGAGGGRPSLATLVYANRIREAFPGLPVALGGVEASTRRFSYFDYQSGRIRRSLLVDSRSDILVYGPGEDAAVEIAHRLAAGRDLQRIAGTARLVSRAGFTRLDGDRALPDHDEVAGDPRALRALAREMERAASPGARGRVVQRYREGAVVCEPPAQLDARRLDEIHALPFARAAHPAYREPIPAFETVRWSVISHRGCPGGCSFCALAIHAGRRTVSRSADSILDEIRALAARSGFRKTVTDIGGPTANAWSVAPRDRAQCERCARPSCLHPRICPNLDTDQTAVVDLLERASAIRGVKRVLVASGVRHDLALRSDDLIEALARRHTGGRLKLAPEHVDPRVLDRMRKPPIEVFERAERRFLQASRRTGRAQTILPYFIAGFPGCDPRAADRVGRWLAARGQRLEQVQGFVPLPGTRAAAWHAAGRDDDDRPLAIPDLAERRRQKRLMTHPPKRSSATRSSAPRSSVTERKRKKSKGNSKRQR